MRKFSRLNESAKIDESEIDRLFSELGCEYEKYDYYSDIKNDRVELRQDIKDVNENSKNSLLIVIKNEKLISGDVDGWDKPLGFNSSGFYFSSPEPQFYSKLYEIFNKLKDHNPKICYKDYKILIILEGDKIDTNIVGIKNEMDALYKKLYKDLEDGIKYEFQYIIKNVDIFSHMCGAIRLTNNLSVQCISSKASNILLSSLCTQLSGAEKYSWMKPFIENNKLNQALVELREYVNQHGFNINFEEAKWSKTNTWRLKLEEI